MSFFYRFVAAAMDLEHFENPTPGMATPYTAFFIFSCGIFLSNFLFNTLAMRRPFAGEPVSYSEYFQGRPATHLVGILGGCIWGLGDSVELPGRRQGWRGHLVCIGTRRTHDSRVMGRMRVEGVQRMPGKHDAPARPDVRPVCGRAFVNHYRRSMNMKKKHILSLCVLAALGNTAGARIHD